jgi:hypothetical protein
MPGQCFRHCLENGGTMGYCSRSPLSNPWTRDILWTTDIGRPQTHTLWGVSKTFKNIYIDPKKDAEKCVQDGSSMIFFPEFSGVHFFYRLGGLLYKSSNMLGELWFCKVMLKRMDFAKDPVPNSHPKNGKTNEHGERTNHYGSLAISMQWIGSHLWQGWCLFSIPSHGRCLWQAFRGSGLCLIRSKQQMSKIANKLPPTRDQNRQNSLESDNSRIRLYECSFQEATVQWWLLRKTLENMDCLGI